MEIKNKLKSVLFFYVRRFGNNPHIRVWTKFLDSYISPFSIVADVGGGEGGLANYLAPKAKRVFILDKEKTSMEGADNSLYAGSLTRAYNNRLYQNITPIKGDAVIIPFKDNSLDFIVSSELIEHFNDNDKMQYFMDCSRVLKTSGKLVISTPNADYIESHSFWLSRLARKLIPARFILRLPFLLRGPWLEQTMEQWEKKVGHYNRGCKLPQLKKMSEKVGFEMLDYRFLHTSMTSFWLQLMFTFPLLYMLSLPIVRFLYFVESQRNAKDGVSLMIVFKKIDA